MNRERSFGFQWQLAFNYLVVSARSALAALTAYLASLSSNILLANRVFAVAMEPN